MVVEPYDLGTDHKGEKTYTCSLQTSFPLNIFNLGSVQFPDVENLDPKIRMLISLPFQLPWPRSPGQHLYYNILHHPWGFPGS